MYTLNGFQLKITTTEYFKYGQQSKSISQNNIADIISIIVLSWKKTKTGLAIS